MRKGLPGGLGNIRVLSGRGRTSAKQPSTTPDQQRKLWDTQVRQGSLSPVDAEKLASEAGQQPFVRVEDRHRLAVREALWPLTMAIFWVAWEDLDRVAQAWAEFEVWRGHLWRYPNKEGQKHSLEEAEHIVFEALRSGRWAATALRGGERYVVEPHVWIDSRWEQLHLRGTLKNKKGIRLEDVRFDQASTSGMKSHITSARESIVSAEMSSSVVNKGGRPKVYDWDAMWIEVCRRIHEEGVPERASKFSDDMKLWFTMRGLKEPSATEMKKKFGDLYKALKREAD